MQLEAKIDALVLLGTTGEPCTLSMDERQRVIEIGLECVGDVIPIIVGTGSNDTRRAIEYARQAQKLGVAGQLSVTPYYNKATQSGLIRHYQAILDACPLPMILYNVPGRTGMGFSADTVARLSRHPAIAGLKEASGNPVFTSEILEKTHGELPVYCGQRRSDSAADVVGKLRRNQRRFQHSARKNTRSDACLSQISYGRSATAPA